MADRFDLEQGIIQCWNIVDEIQLLLDNWDNLDEDGKQNMLIGLKQLYQLKFQTTFSHFEHCVASRLV
jgi:hypothetical protein